MNFLITPPTCMHLTYCGSYFLFLVIRKKPVLKPNDKKDERSEIEMSMNIKIDILLQQ